MISRRLAAALTAGSLALVGATSYSMTAASAFGSGVWDRVAACESGGNWAINTGNGFYGGLQFTHQTWQGYGGGVYAYNANGASKAAQITIAQRVLIGQGPGAWPVCSIRGGLTRTNGEGIVVSRSHTRTTLHRASAKLVVDGIFGPLTKASLARHSIHLSNRHVIRAWQARLRLPRTGFLDHRTAMSMQRWLNARP